MNNFSPIITVSNLKTYLGGRWVHDGIDFTINKSEIFAIVGGSGSGKTTLLRCLLTLQNITAGEVKIFDTIVNKSSWNTLLPVKKRFGVMFQSGALFSSLTLIDNVAFPLKRFTHLSKTKIYDIARAKIILSGLDENSIHQFPAELSGGMQKRAAFARAMALDPEILFLDEPTAGLDPVSANELDELILNFKKSSGITVVMITHDLDTLWNITDRVAFLGDGKILAIGSMSELAKNPHPTIQAYLHGARGQRFLV